MHRHRLYRAAFVIALVAGATASTAATVVIRQNDFDGNVVTAPGIGYTPINVGGASVPVGGYSAFGFSGNMYRNAGSLGNNAVGASLTNLPVGGTLSFSFLFAAIDSWDGTNASFGPDFFELLIDGTVVWSTAISNFPPASSNGGLLLGTLAASSAGNVFAANFPDSAWDFTNVSGLQNIAYSGTSTTFEFRAAGAGWQGGLDESFGVDNFLLTVTTAQVPEPMTAMLVLAGLLSAAGSRRLHRASAG